MRIRRMEERDIPVAARIEAQCFSRPWGEKELRDCLKKDFYVFFTASDDADGTVLGYIGMYRVLEEGDITQVAVSPDSRRRGIGEALLRALLTYAKENGIEAVTLEVRDSNVPAIGLYTKLGFKQIGLRKGYYSEPVEDARIYALQTD